MSLLSVNGSDLVKQHHEKTLLRLFGANPFGENLWRVVWSDSRKHMVGGKWRDHSGKPADDAELLSKGHDPNFVREVTEYRWIPLYPGFHGWVIEKWLSALQFCGTPMSYEMLQLDTSTGLLPLPYPSRGEYLESQRLPPHMEPGISFVTKIINMVRAGEKYKAADHKNAIVEGFAKKEKAQEARALDIWKNAQGAFNNAPQSGAPGKRTADKVQLRYSAEDVRLPKPQHNGQFFALKDNPNGARP